MQQASLGILAAGFRGGPAASPCQMERLPRETGGRPDRTRDMWYSVSVAMIRLGSGVLRWFAAYGELVKARLTLLVVFTTASGFLLASPGGDASTLIWTALGTFLSAAGAMALNQLWEVERDRMMPRTAKRPLVTGFFSRRHGLTVGLVAAASGVTLLAWWVNRLTALLSLVVVLLYLLVYTPLKAKSPFCTLVGAVCGALPPMMGWAAARGRLETGALLLGALLFFWQIPHFLSLAWLYRDQYRQGGFRMLPEYDPQGRLTGSFALLYTLATVATTLTLFLARLAGGGFAAVAFLGGLGFLLPAWQLAKTPTSHTAKKLFLASLAYLPLVLAALLMDHQPLPSPSPRTAAVDATS